MVAQPQACTNTIEVLVNFNVWHWLLYLINNKQQKQSCLNTRIKITKFEKFL